MTEQVDGTAAGEGLATIIMPVYDGEPFVAEAVRSVLDQTCAEVRLIVVDDGSRDATPITLASFHDPRMQVITLPENGGRSAAVRAGLAHVRTPYVGFCGADDVQHPTLVEKELAFLRAHPEVDVVSCQLQPIDETGRDVPGRVDLPLTHEGIVEAMLVGAAISQGGSLGRTEVLTRIGFAAPFDVAEDYFLWVEMLLDGRRFANLSEDLYLYRQHPRQSMRAEREEMLHAHLAVQRMLVDRLWPDADEAVREDVKAWLAWCHTSRSRASVRERAVMDRSLRVTEHLVAHRSAVLPEASVRSLRRRVIAQELVAWGGVPSLGQLRRCAREVPPRDLPRVALRALTTH